MSDAMTDARRILQQTEYARGYESVEQLRAAVVDLMAEVSILSADRDSWKRVAREYESALSERSLL